MSADNKRFVPTKNMRIVNNLINGAIEDGIGLATVLAPVGMLFLSALAFLAGNPALGIGSLVASPIVTYIANETHRTVSSKNLSPQRATNS